MASGSLEGIALALLPPGPHRLFIYTKQQILQVLYLFTTYGGLYPSNFGRSAYNKKLKQLIKNRASYCCPVFPARYPGPAGLDSRALT